MAILIKNPEVERKARELASLRGESITAVINGALDKALAEAQPPTKRKPTLDEMIEATHRFRKAVGLDKRSVDTSRARFDEINEIPGFKEGD